MFEDLTGKNKHEKRLERLKGIRENLKKDHRIGLNKDINGDKIISLEQKGRRKAGSKVLSPKMFAVDRKSDGSGSRGPSPLGRKTKKGKKADQ